MKSKIKNIIIISALSMLALFTLNSNTKVSTNNEPNLPKKLEVGDTIGIVATSCPTTQENIDTLISYFNHRGYHVKISEHCLDRFGFLTAKAEDLAIDFNKMVKDESVKMILLAYGGSGAIHLLPLIDYDEIKKNPKLICGYSDHTVLLNTITSKTDVPTFHGIDGEIVVFMESESVTEKTWFDMVTGDIELPYVYQTDSLKVLKHGKPVSGRLIGGNGSSLLFGTDWLPVPEHTILAIEGVSYTPNRLDSFLAKLRILGVLDSIDGLIIGRYQGYNYRAWWGEDLETLEDIVLRNCEGYDFPIVYNVLIGHTAEKITLPIGTQFKLDTEKKQISLLEHVVK